MTQPPSAVTAFIGFGANLGQPEAAFEFAARRIDALPRTRLVARSSLYRSEPIGVTDQPDFHNAVLQIDTRLAPLTLLEALLAIEIEGGRTRPYLSAPRTLDLDVLLYADAIVQEAELVIPHPRMHERAFVLLPLAEIAPEVRIPGQGDLEVLLARVAHQRIERLPART